MSMEQQSPPRASQGRPCLPAPAAATRRRHLLVPCPASRLRGKSPWPLTAPLARILHRLGRRATLCGKRHSVEHPRTALPALHRALLGNRHQPAVGRPFCWQLQGRNDTRARLRAARTLSGHGLLHPCLSRSRPHPLG